MMLISELESILRREKAAAIDGVLKGASLFEAEVVQVSKKLIILQCPNAGEFKIGDVVGYIPDPESSPANLGIVVDTYSDTLILNPYTTPSEDRFDIFQSENLISYDLQLRFLERVATKDLDAFERMAAEVVFGDSKMPEIKRVWIPNYGFQKPSERLDEFQKEAVESILGLEPGELLLIVGPPGTGKTRVIANAAIRLANMGEKVLIASHTNLAVDNALERIPPYMAVRVGLPDKTTLKNHLIDSKVRQSLGKRLQVIDDRIKEYKKQLWRSLKLRKFSKAAELREDLLNLYKERERVVRYAEEDILDDAKIVGTTLIKSNLQPVSGYSFDVVLIDESSQVSITLALLGMIKAKKYVLVGDHHQLMPVFRTRINPEKYSAFTFLKKKYPNRVVWLRRHYRSHSKIVGLTRFFYEEEIIPADTCSRIRLNIRANGVLSPDKPVVFLNVSGIEDNDSGSKSNVREAEACGKLVRALLKYGVPAKEIACITPYRAQVELIKNVLSKHGIDGVEVGTVDAFQGKEKDVVIYSVTATSNFWFAANPNRLNVAFSRPRKKLIVVGNASRIMMNGGVLKKFLNYCIREKSLFQASQLN